jgi:hypothetical protein
MIVMGSSLTSTIPMNNIMDLNVERLGDDKHYIYIAIKK